MCNSEDIPVSAHKQFCLPFTKIVYVLIVFLVFSSENCHFCCQIFKKKILIKFLTQWKRRQKDYKSQKVLRTPGEQGPMNQLSKAHIQRQKQQARSLLWSSPSPVFCVWVYMLCVCGIYMCVLAFSLVF